MALTLSSIVVCMATTVLATPTVPSPVLAADDSCLADGSCALNALQARVAESALDDRSLLTARLPNCKCPGGKSAKCGCYVNGEVGCCQWQTCYPKKSCGAVPSSAVDVDAAPAPASAPVPVSGATVAAAAGCSSASLLQTQYNCEVSTYSSWEYSKKVWCCKIMPSPPAGCSIVNANAVGPACCGVLQQTAVAAGCSASLLQHTIPGGGMVSKTVGAATSATVAVGNAAESATGSYFVIEQTGEAAGCTFQHSENTACCQSLRQAAGTAGCSLSLSAVDATVSAADTATNAAVGRIPSYQAKKEEAEAKKNEKIDQAQAKKDEKKDQAEDKKDQAQAKKDEKKDQAQAKKEEKKAEWR